MLATGIFADQHGGLVPTWPSLIEFLAADPDDHDLSPQSLSTAVRDPARRAVATWAIGRSGQADTHLATMLTTPSGPADPAHLTELQNIAADEQQPRTVRRAVQLFFAEQSLL